MSTITVDKAALSVAVAPEITPELLQAVVADAVRTDMTAFYLFGCNLCGVTPTVLIRVLHKDRKHISKFVACMDCIKKYQLVVSDPASYTGDPP